MCLPWTDAQLSKYLLRLLLSSRCLLVLAPLGPRSEIFPGEQSSSCPFSTSTVFLWGGVCVVPWIVCGQSTNTLIVPTLHCSLRSSAHAFLKWCLWSWVICTWGKPCCVLEALGFSQEPAGQLESGLYFNREAQIHIWRKHNTEQGKQNLLICWVPSLDYWGGDALRKDQGFLASYLFLVFGFSLFLSSPLFKLKSSLVLLEFKSGILQFHKDLPFGHKGR